MAESSSSTQLLIELTTHTLLFLLIFGMSATVDSNNLRRQLSNKDAILTGVAMQFIIMPLLGFIAVYTLKDHGLTTAMGLSLLIVTSSPGGSYSNWWCSLFNADLALSVAMTALSTILSTALLPANLILYSYLAYGLGGEKSVLGSINFGKLFVSIAIVIVAIIAGLYASFTVDSSKFRKVSNHMGSVSGILLIVFSAVFSSTSEADATPWSHPWSFYVATVLPCLFGLAISNLIAARLAKLDKPEVVTLSIECCYQNVGIATSAAVAMFDDSVEVAEALAVTLVYGMVEIVVLGTYCIFAWKMGWTKAPKEEAICTVLCTSFEIERADSFVSRRNSNIHRSKSSMIQYEGDDQIEEIPEEDLEIGNNEIDSCDKQVVEFYVDDNEKVVHLHEKRDRKDTYSTDGCCDSSEDIPPSRLKLVSHEDEIEVLRQPTMDDAEGIVCNSTAVGTITGDVPPNDDLSDNLSNGQKQDYVRRLMFDRSMASTSSNAASPTQSPDDSAKKGNSRIKFWKKSGGKRKKTAAHVIGDATDNKTTTP